MSLSAPITSLNTIYDLIWLFLIPTNPNTIYFSSPPTFRCWNQMDREQPGRPLSSSAKAQSHKWIWRRHSNCSGRRTSPLPPSSIRQLGMGRYPPCPRPRGVRTTRSGSRASGPCHTCPPTSSSSMPWWTFRDSSPKGFPQNGQPW